MSDDDPDLFRRMMSKAKPLRTDERVAHPQKKPKPKARFTRADEKEALRQSMLADIDTMQDGNADSLRFRRASVGRRTMRKLARGRFSVQAEIDLHGMTVAEARPRLSDFIADCAKQGLLCVRVVHGKGLGSGHKGPVLKNSVNAWLRKWNTVLAFVSARQVDGGTGAIYVLLQAP
ncbi:MAG: Smr/MutS family protein [Gammaproteobacteria bacterium]|nr:Smr/MutS family protein [Gammaproteobacteria bacterium]MDH3372746.1 Smr/MutS family protein [Gammaproteobacteria bacterium]MDH3408899.1 Smr/MutS family protein [Gammaproteobacteria bacterium]MDH3553287.1 Smr/MutS family protein [Gammaproteobacteria bacterium]